MARVADNEGHFRYGMRQVKVAALAEYSPSTIKRAQAALVAHGLVERVKVGGGRVSTKWRILVHKLTGQTELRTGSRHAPDQQPGPRGPALMRRLVIHGISRQATPRTNEITYTCEEHGGAAGYLPNGLPACPQCRRHRARE